MERRHFLTLAAGALLAACGGASTDADVAAPADPSPSPSPTPTSTPSSDASPSSEPFDITSQPDVDYPEGIDPHRLLIAAIGVDAPIIDLSITAAEVEVPEDFDDTGWWTTTRRPGEIGPAVIGGHVDSKSGPAVFFRLRDLAPGDEIIVEDEAGEQVLFVVDEGIQIDKYERPPEVFGFGQGRPELRLITCGGDFDPSVGHYTDNYVIFAHQPDFVL